MNVAFSILLVLAAFIGAWLIVGPLLWALWYIRRTFWRSKRFSLRSLLFAFTIVALLIGTFAALVREVN